MVRRVVAGHISGNSAFLADGAPAKSQIFRETPGMETHFLWATSKRPSIVSNDPAEGFGSDRTFLPAAGETRFIYLQVAPQSVVGRSDFDAQRAAAEMLNLQPEMFALMEPNSPGMHRTESVDYVIVLDGEIYLELDDGAEVLLRRHDVVIQLGTRHAWHNRTSEPVLLAVVLVGAERR